jgi:carnitine 3-dehydrogenase
MIPAPNIQQVAVVGAGLIGSSWATHFLARGLDVTVADPAPGAEQRTRDYVERAWPIVARLGLAPQASPTRLRFVASAAIS